MLDTLGTLIGFVSVVLILSLITTSFVQMSSSLLRLRGRNLGRGLAVLLDAAAQSSVKGGKAAHGTSKGAAMDSSALAQQISTAQELMNPGRNIVPGVVPTWLRSTSQTWISRGQLKTVLENIGNLPAGFVDKAVDLFPQFENATAKRFSFFMRVNSIIWALIVAVVFQISTPDLLRTLSADPGLRARYEEAFEDAATYPDVALQAFERLKNDHPQTKDVTWAPPAGNASRRDILASLRTAIGGVGEPETLVAAYTKTLDQIYLDQVKSSVANLGKLDIRPWGKGLEFYWVGGENGFGILWENIIGVLMTAVLLTLGAPFWFKALKNLSGLRDLLSSATGNNGGAGQGQGAQSGP